MTSTSRKQARRRREFRRQQLQHDPHCWFCGYRLTIETSSIDHIEPRSAGGRDTPDNWLLSCRRCNRTKGDRPLIGLAVCRVPTFGVLTERRMQAIREQHGETLPRRDPPPHQAAAVDRPPTE